MLKLCISDFAITQHPCVSLKLNLFWYLIEFFIMGSPCIKSTCSNRKFYRPGVFQALRYLVRWTICFLSACPQLENLILKDYWFVRFVWWKIFFLYFITPTHMIWHVIYTHNLFDIRFISISEILFLCNHVPVYPLCHRHDHDPF